MNATKNETTIHEIKLVVIEAAQLNEELLPYIPLINLRIVMQRKMDFDEQDDILIDGHECGVWQLSEEKNFLTATRYSLFGEYFGVVLLNPKVKWEDKGLIFGSLEDAEEYSFLKQDLMKNWLNEN